MQHSDERPNDKTREIYPDQPEEPKNEEQPKARPVKGQKKNFRPIILCLTFLWIGMLPLFAQFEGSITMGLHYTDNVFQLSDYDFESFDDDSSALAFAETTDDLSISTKLDLAYPIHYRWWKFTPSVSGVLSQTLSNTDKYRQDTLLRFRVDRYYWNASLMYGYYPHIYYRHFTDADGSGQLEKYGYQKNLYQADLQLRPLRKATIFAKLSYDDTYYNEYFTEADGHSLTSELGARYAFPSFSLQGSYGFRQFDNTGYQDLDADDGSYDSNIYRGVLRMSPMALSGTSTKDTSWQPYLELSREDRFYQGNSEWYGGREYHYTNTKAGVDVKLSPKWNLSLDYLHIFRKVDSPNASVLRLKEFSENRLGAGVKYNF